MRWREIVLAKALADEGGMVPVANCESKMKTATA
jgi:hypothetical protein